MTTATATTTTTINRVAATATTTTTINTAAATTSTSDTAAATAPSLASATAPATVPAHQRTVIDLCSPEEVVAALQLDETALLDLVNRGALAAYRIAGAIRFRVSDVEAMRLSLVAA